MSVSDNDIRAIYVGDGVNTTFPIVFQWQKENTSQIVVKRKVISTEVVTVLEEGTDYEVPIVDDIFQDEVEFLLGAPTTDHEITVERSTEKDQIYEFNPGEALYSKNIEMGLDRAVMMIQEVGDEADRAIKLAEDAAGFDGTLPTPVADSVLATNEDGSELEWILKSDLASGLPVGGAVNDFLEKASADDRDVQWGAGLFEGYSARYSQSLSLQGLRAALLYIFNFQYQGPAVSLSMTGSGTLREKGVTVSGPITMTAGITKRSDPIATVRFYEGASLLDTQTSGGGIPTGGNSTYNWNGASFSDNKTFNVQVDDDGSTGGPTTASASVTFSFVYPYYAGAGAASLTAANVALLTKLVIASTASVVRTITASGGDVLYFAYPASYGALTSILDVNNFETINDWTLRTENITGLDGNAVSYRIYEFDNPVAAGSYQYTFKR